MDVDGVPNGDQTITVNSGDEEKTVTPMDNTEYVLSGRQCASTSPAGTPGQAPLWLGLLGLLWWRRRRKQHTA